MGRVREGGKAGITAGMIYAVTTALVVAALEYGFESRIMGAISSEAHPGTTVSLDTLYELAVGGSIAVAIVFGIILSLILGLVFGAVSNRIPGQRAIAKGLVFGFLMWLILHVFADLLNLKYGAAFYLSDIGLGLATSLLYGALLGTLFERRMKRLASPAPS